MTTVQIFKYPHRLPDPASAPLALTVAHDGWVARLLGEPPDVEGLTRATAGEWLAGWMLAHQSAMTAGLALEIWKGRA
jgi:hypothetical protein